MVWRKAAAMAFNHHRVGGFDVGCEKLGVEQRPFSFLLAELSLDGSHFLRLARELDCEALIVVSRRHDQFAQIERRQKASRHPASKGGADPGQGTGTPSYNASSAVV